MWCVVLQVLENGMGQSYFRLSNVAGPFVDEKTAKDWVEAWGSRPTDQAGRLMSFYPMPLEAPPDMTDEKPATAVAGKI